MDSSNEKSHPMRDCFIVEGFRHANKSKVVLVERFPAALGQSNVGDSWRVRHFGDVMGDLFGLSESKRRKLDWFDKTSTWRMLLLDGDALLLLLLGIVAAGFQIFSAPSETN